MSLKEQYWKYSLIVIILLLGVLIFLKITPFLGGILGAMTVYILLREHMIYLTDRKHIRRSIAAILILIETILCFLIPLALIIWMFVNKFQDANLNPRSIIDPVTNVANLIQEKTGYNLLSKANINSIFALLPRIGQVLMGSVTSFCHQCIGFTFRTLFYANRGKEDGELCQ